MRKKHAGSVSHDKLSRYRIRQALLILTITIAFILFVSSSFGAYFRQAVLIDGGGSFCGVVPHHEA